MLVRWVNMATKLGSRIPAAASAAMSAAAITMSRDPASALERTRAALATIEADIADLWAERDRVLADTEDTAAVEAIDQKLENRNKAARVYRDRIPILQGKFHDARQRDREARKAEHDLPAFEQALTDRAAGAALVQKGAEQIAAGLRMYREATRRAFATWPDTFPSLAIYESYANDLLANEIGAHLRMPQGAPRELLVNLPARLGDLGEREIQRTARIVASIRDDAIPPELDNTEHDEQERAA